jgi:hypothetical protein
MKLISSNRNAAPAISARRRARLCASVVALCASIVAARGQGTIRHITFDGPPLLQPGSRISVAQYDEASMSFTPLGPSFTRVGMNPSPSSGAPDDGTAYLAAAFTQSLRFSLTNGSAFDLVSVDLAEYSTAFAQPITVQFVGYRPDGSTVTADLVTDGVIDGTGPLADFQTFTFSKDFTGLTRVEIPTWAWSLDNLYVSVPEPGTGLLFLVGAGLAWAAKRRPGRNW